MSWCAHRIKRFYIPKIRCRINSSFWTYFLIFIWFFNCTIRRMCSWSYHISLWTIKIIVRTTYIIIPIPSKIQWRIKQFIRIRYDSLIIKQIFFIHKIQFLFCIRTNAPRNFLTHCTCYLSGVFLYVIIIHLHRRQHLTIESSRCDIGEHTSIEVIWYANSWYWWNSICVFI